MLVERGMDPSRIELLPNPVSGLPTNASELSSPGDFVLFLGRLVPNKGCDILIRSMVSIPSARLEIVGDGPERARLEKIVASLGMGDRVAFLGWRSPGEVRERLSEARVLAVPALWPEPFGLVALEAYAAGRPVVASSIGGLLDTVLDGKTGLLVPPGEPGRLSVALQRLLADRNLAERMGHAGLDRVRNRYGMEAHIESLERIYEQTTSVDSAG
jgi:glycosyltransferase involved in cell wall biosynthesis